MLPQRARVLAGGLMIAAAAISGCSANTTKPAEPAPRAQSGESVPAQPIQLLQPTLTPAETKSLTGTQPQPEELKAAVARVFQTAAIADGTKNPNFVIGDFNGDGSEDLAVITKPND